MTTTDSHDLTTRARRDPEAFREETARALEAAGDATGARYVRSNDPDRMRAVLRVWRRRAKDPAADRAALAHVRALAAAHGVDLEDT